jgi:hypothetical protein
MRYWLSIIIIGLVTCPLEGQDVSPALISSSGTQMKSNQVQLQWSLGEFIIGQTMDPNFQLSLGFHQNLSLGSSTSTAAVKTEVPYQVFPNPTTAIIHIKMQQFGRITYQLQDALGNLILRGSFVNNTIINTTSLPTGTYFLNLSQRQKKLGTSKIIKI